MVMRKDKPSQTARKVALNIVTLGSKPGAVQILVLGAGYDTLGWRLAPELLLTEIRDVLKEKK